ncbi:MAG TPA: hypothetical protein PLZ42_02500 [Methanothrix sp.]|nr:hypothetical protein [Methanothrix sp.]
MEKSDKIEQGDILSSWPVIIPEEWIDGVGDIDTSIEEYDMIIMSQSCDIQNNKIDNVLVCPVLILDEMGKYTSSGDRNKLRKGEIIGYHLLNKCEVDGLTDCGLLDLLDKYLVVDFRNAYSIPLKFLIGGVDAKHEKRLRLLPPYKEHLSQAFARFIMRVGLPEEIPDF